MNIDIANLPDEKLAELLTLHNKWRRGEGEYGEPGAESPLTPKELGILLDTVSDRLTRSKPKKENL